MKRAIVSLLLVGATLSAAEWGGGRGARPERGDRVAVLVLPADEPRRIDRDPAGIIGRAVESELERRGYEAVVLPRSVNEMEEDGIVEAVDVAWIVEIAASDARADSWGEIGTDGRVEGVAVAGAIAIVSTELFAELRLYDGRTLELLETFELDSRATSPTISGVGLGGRRGGMWLSLPWRHPYGRAARALAREAVARITMGGGAADAR